MNVPTLIIALILTAIVALIIRKMIKDKKNGVHSCGGNCGACGACKGCSFPEIQRDKKT